MKKIGLFFLLILAFVGIVGGIGYTAWCKAYVITVGLVAAGYMAYPKFVECFRSLTK